VSSALWQRGSTGFVTSTTIALGVWRAIGGQAGRDVDHDELGWLQAGGERGDGRDPDLASADDGDLCVHPCVLLS
jgi:hypothetical protein